MSSIYANDMLLAHVDNAFLELIDDTSSISQESGGWRVVKKSGQWVFNQKKIIFNPCLTQ